MPKPDTVAAMTELGRVRLSEHFFMRDMLMSEVASIHGLANVPEDPAAAIESGEKLCRLILEPMHKAFGGIAIRSAYRSPEVNDFCHQQYKQGRDEYFCSDNEYNRARHCWDKRDAAGHLGATTSLIVPWYLDAYEKSGDFRPLGWWIRDHIEHYDEVIFYPRQCAFNIRWYAGPSKRTVRWSAPDEKILLTEDGMDGFDGDHSEHYPGFPA